MYHILETLGCQYFFLLNLANRKKDQIQQLLLEQSPDCVCVCVCMCVCARARVVLFSDEQLCFRKGKPPFPPPVPGGQV